MLDELKKRESEKGQANREAIRKAQEQAEKAYLEHLSQAERERFADNKQKLTESTPAPAPSTSPTNASESRSREAGLSGLSLEDGVRDEAIPLAGFDAETLNYDVTVPYEVSIVRVVPTAKHARASILVNGAHTASGTASDAIALPAISTTELAVQVTAEDGATKRTYKVKVTRAPSTNAALAGIAVNGASIPSFTPSVTSYRVEVNYEVETAVLTAEPVDGATVVSGTGTESLEPGDNIFTIVVQAMNGATKTYQLNVHRGSNEAALSDLKLLDPNGAEIAFAPTFESGITDYTVSVPHDIWRIRVRPQASQTHAVLSQRRYGRWRGPVGTDPSDRGAETVVETAVTSEDGTATRTYRVAFTREELETDAALIGFTFTDDKSNPIPLAQTIDPATTDYTVAAAVYAVNYTVDTVKLTPVASGSHATIKVNGTHVASGGTISLPINPGTNTISIVVTAKYGVTTQTYTLTVKRKPSLNFQISQTPNQKIVSGWTGLDPDVYVYHVTIDTTKSQLTAGWGPVPGCTNTGLSNSGILTGTTTELTITAKSQDGTIEQTYTFYVTKASTS
ncbi:cadherin-like beta sandwich domain-containing protein [Cohnella caldifontis]|uniref:cadherin-like beta sandwich domain-containing protein n=1 Tax=Cohnella caldifontis TaxID=3027471 RepID=UPI0023ED0BBF|nr:cadherin-like beta sandwich domain-containing protein [Cohnella sp. YIM B05605]